jgi:hypothetical protein
VGVAEGVGLVLFLEPIGRLKGKRLLNYRLILAIRFLSRRERASASALSSKESYIGYRSMSYVVASRRSCLRGVFTVPLIYPF